MGAATSYDKVNTEECTPEKAKSEKVVVYCGVIKKLVDLSEITKNSVMFGTIQDRSPSGYIRYTVDNYGISLSLRHPKYETIYNMIETNKYYLVSTYNNNLVSIEPDVTFVVGKVKSLIKTKDTDISPVDYHEIIFEDHPVVHHVIDVTIRLLINTSDVSKVKAMQESLVKFTAKRFKDGRYLVEEFEKI